MFLHIKTSLLDFFIFRIYKLKFHSFSHFSINSNFIPNMNSIFHKPVIKPHKLNHSTIITQNSPKHSPSRFYILISHIYNCSLQNHKFICQNITDFLMIISIFISSWEKIKQIIKCRNSQFFKFWNICFCNTFYFYIFQIFIKQVICFHSHFRLIYITFQIKSVYVNQIDFTIIIP